MKKLKVQIFQNNYLQQEINQWLSAHPSITIVNITQSSSESRVTISIFYQDS